MVLLVDTVTNLRITDSEAAFTGRFVRRYRPHAPTEDARCEVSK